MEKAFTILLVLVSLNLFAQDKFNHVNFNKLTTVEGTEYVIASIENRGKGFKVKDKYLLFINTINGDTTQIDFPKDGRIQKVEQVKIENLRINKIIIEAKTIDLDGKKGIGWNDPSQLFILSTDGKEKTLLTGEKLFVQSWVVNQQTGTITITGHYDSNNNRKHDKSDKSEIGIYDLKSLKLLYKI